VVNINGWDFRFEIINPVPHSDWEDTTFLSFFINFQLKTALSVDFKGSNLKKILLPVGKSISNTKLSPIKKVNFPF